MVSQTNQGRDWQKQINDFSSGARKGMEEGAVTDSYRANQEEVVRLLNLALASEWTAFMQYWHHYIMATDIHSIELKEYFKEASAQELHHIDEIGTRIQLLGGVPVAKPAEIPKLWPNSVEYAHDLVSMLKADLLAERTTVAFYSEIVRFCDNDDITTRVLFEEILREEEEHANDLADLIYAHDATTGEVMESLHDEAAHRGGAQQRRAA